MEIMKRWEKERQGKKRKSKERTVEGDERRKGNRKKKRATRK